MAPSKPEGQDHGVIFSMAPPPPMGPAGGPGEAPGSVPPNATAGRPGAGPTLTLQPPGPGGYSWENISFTDFDWSLYDYHPADDGGFWQLQEGYPPSETLPSLIPLSATNQSPIQQPKDIEWTCLTAACPAKPFKRKADLDLHYKQAHSDTMPMSITPTPVAPPFDGMAAGVVAGMVQGVPPGAVPNVAPGPAQAMATPSAVQGSAAAAPPKDVKEKEAMFYCDYSACPKRTDGFNRRDRFRLHLHDTHKEDVIKKGGKIEDSWLDTRKMSNKWWRCSRCLERIKIDEHGWECPKDQVKCEQKRREKREAI